MGFAQNIRLDCLPSSWHGDHDLQAATSLCRAFDQTCLLGCPRVWISGSGVAVVPEPSSRGGAACFLDYCPCFNSAQEAFLFVSYRDAIIIE